jgi:uncharacterized membrane protein
MNAAHFHLMFNHLSIVGLGFAILFNLLAVFGKSKEIKTLSCWFYILTASLSVLAIVTGDGAQEIVKTYPGISVDIIEYHETWAYAFFYGLLATGALAIGALWFSRKNVLLLKKFNIAMLVAALLVLVLAFQAGTTGGKIRHPEIEQGVYQKQG